MAEIKKRFKKNGEPSYTASIRIQGHKSVTKTFKRKTDAKAWADKTETEIRENINFPKRKAQNKVRSLNNDYIFKALDGKPQEYLIGKLFPKIVKQCGIKDFRFHDLRHTGASWQAMSGISQPITQKILGHKSPAMTDRYSHLRDDSLRPAINQTGDKMLKEFLKVQ